MDKLISSPNGCVDLLQGHIPLRLAVQANDSFPHIVSLWFKYHDGAFYCVSHKSAWVLQQIAGNNRVGFEIATNTPPYKGIRGVGHCKVQSLEDDLLEQLIVNYLGDTNSRLAQWLLSRQDDERVIQISPIKLTSWDYSERMGGCTDD